jgi:hypothetical protein
MFTKIVLDLPHNVHHELAASAPFEDITKGRKGAILISDGDHIPLIRSTTNYINPPQPFLPIHRAIIGQIQKHVCCEFNNAMIEIYTPEYRKMGYHSDLALDLAPHSHIAIFSCYAIFWCTPRKLFVVDKKEGAAGAAPAVIIMEHNSVIVFSTETNCATRHKIVLDSMRHPADWLGITFRLSKTFIRFVNEIPYFAGEDPAKQLILVAGEDPAKQLILVAGEDPAKQLILVAGEDPAKQLMLVAGEDPAKQLMLVAAEQKREFFRMRGQENKKIDFAYPAIEYTLSGGDLVPPIEAAQRSLPDSY